MNTWDSGTGYIKHGRDKYLHRTVVEQVLGRSLKKQEQVHHVNGDGTDNSHSNLVVCPNMAYHKLLHARQKVLELGGNPNTDKYCSYHKTLHNVSLFSSSPKKWDGLNNNCRVATNEYRKDNGLNKKHYGWRENLNQQYRRAFKGGMVTPL